MDLDHHTGTVRIDWHGYAPDQVAIWSDQVIAAAYEHGFNRVEFVHGATDVAARGTPGWRGDQVEGRGRVKGLLRSRLYGKHWRRWARDVREGEHRIFEGRMVVALRENPEPDPAARWPVIPPPAY
jgi:hypothetical protein